ncbi:hypothetical protein C8Q72DRAFT_346785 [Fomitopsis betulina]|nr:hypothetical protein C8Q72DRAFT_346785 [Fomitopsis betulina]
MTRDGSSPIARLLPLTLLRPTSTAAYGACPRATALGGSPMVRKPTEGHASAMPVSVGTTALRARANSTQIISRNISTSGGWFEGTLDVQCHLDPANDAGLATLWKLEA